MRQMQKCTKIVSNVPAVVWNGLHDGAGSVPRFFGSLIWKRSQAYQSINRGDITATPSISEVHVCSCNTQSHETHPQDTPTLCIRLILQNDSHLSPISWGHAGISRCEKDQHHRLLRWKERHYCRSSRSVHTHVIFNPSSRLHWESGSSQGSRNWRGHRLLRKRPCRQ